MEIKELARQLIVEKRAEYVAEKVIFHLTKNAEGASMTKEDLENHYLDGEIIVRILDELQYKFKVK